MMLKALLWKDFRQHGKLLAACGVLFLMPYFFAVVALIVNRLSTAPSEEWIRFFSAASIANAFLAIVLVAFFAGNAIAGERADRSAEFAAYLPIDRKTAVLSKVITTLGICVVLLTVMSLVAWLLSPSDMLPEENGLFLSTAIPLFGVAWFCSSFARTPGIATVVAIAFPICVGVTCGFLMTLESMNETDMTTVFMVVGTAVGLLCFAAGVVNYVRRVEP